MRNRESLPFRVGLFNRQGKEIVGMKKVYLFQKRGCVACENLRRYLDSKGIEYKTISGDTAKGISTMRTNEIFLSFYPALCVENRLYQFADLFDSKGNILDLESILHE
jgi:hypothetical protein